MPRTVVLIDDEPDLVEMLQTALELKGYKTHAASSGEKGLKLIEDIAPDAVICDLMMPGMSGLEVCKRLRSDPKTKDLPIVVISALGAKSDKPEEFWSAGLKSDDFISKPFEAHELIGRLEYVLRKQDYVSTKPAPGPLEQEGAEPGQPPRPMPLTDAPPRAVVKAFIESWNRQDFETEYKCMDAKLTAGLGLKEYIARRRQVRGEEPDRTQELTKVIDEQRTADEATMRIEREDFIQGRTKTSREEYQLKKGSNGWKIAMVRKMPG